MRFSEGLLQGVGSLYRGHTAPRPRPGYNAWASSPCVRSIRLPGLLVGLKVLEIADHPAWARWSRFLAAGDACGIVIAAAFDFKPGWPATLGGIRALKDNVVNSYCAFAERIERRGGAIPAS